MPNRYEREIEEILNRMEESEPHKGLGDRIRPFRQRRRPARPRGLPMPHIALMELLFLLAIVFILIASGLAFYEGAPTVISGAIGSVGLLLFVVALVAGWRDRFRPPTQSQWRGTSLEPNRNQRAPFGGLAARVRIWRLRQQYRRGQARQGDLDD